MPLRGVTFIILFELFFWKNATKCVSLNKGESLEEVNM